MKMTLTATKRKKILYLLLAVWALAALAANFRIAVVRRAYYVEQGRRIAGHSGEYYLPRARIFAGDGTLLAWSEKYFDLVWTADDPCPEKLSSVLQNIMNRTPDLSGNTMYADIDAEAIVQLEPLLRRNRHLQVRSRVERNVTSDSRFHRIIGKTVMSGGRLTGVSGAEKEFDSTLSGKPGRYSVMLDRRGEWIYDTWRLQNEPVAGKDVVISMP